MTTACAAGHPTRAIDFVFRAARLLFAVLVLTGAAASAAEAATAYAVTQSTNILVRFDTDTPANVTSVGAITGLSTGYQVIDLDIRPKSAQLYALAVNASNQAQVYRLNLFASGPTATLVTATPLTFTGVSGAMDFDATNDLIRVTSAAGETRFVNPDNGSVPFPGSALTIPVTTVALAYTNNFHQPTASTLFGIDQGSGGRLVRIGATNATDGGADGIVTPINAIAGGGASVDAISGFDITANTGEAYATLVGTGGQSGLYRIDLTTGAATSLGNVGNSFGRLRGLAVFTRASLIYGVNTSNQLVIFLSAVPSDIRYANGSDAPDTPFAITGITGQVIGLDTRPSTGELFAITTTNQIFKITPPAQSPATTATATPVASLTENGSPFALTGTAFGMYFEPGSPETIRVVSNASQNLAIDPDSGVVSPKPNLNNDGNSLVALARDLRGNLWGIDTVGDSAGDQLMAFDAIQGKLFLEAPLGFNSSNFASLDVAQSDGELFAALTVPAAGASDFYLIRPGTSTLVTKIGLSIAGGAPLAAMCVASQGFVRLNPVAYISTEGPNKPVPVTVERMAGADGPLTFELNVTDGTAIAGSDYTAAHTTYTFLAGAAPTISPVAVLLIDDAATEPAETINVTVTPSSLYGPATPDQVSTALITVVDDDATMNPTVQITSPTTDPTYTAGSLFVALQGSAADPDGTVSNISWVSDQGFSGEASGTTDWIINVVPLKKGVNTITVIATDNTGRTGSDTIVITVNELTYYLAEGATSAFFTTDILIANPTDEDASLTVQFLNESGPLSPTPYTVPKQSRISIRVNDLPGMSAAGGLSTIVTSKDAVPIIVERTMFWGDGAYGSATDHASDGASTKWYFAEGAQGFFRTYLLLANPRDGANVAHVRYLRDNEPVFTRDYNLARYQRFTVDIGSHPELRFRTFGIEVTFDQPGVAERAMYFGTSPLWLGGHESGGVNNLSRSWFLAEGATGSYFKTYILLTNPTSQDAAVDVDFLPSFGSVISKHMVVPANERRSVDIAGEDTSLRNAAVATRVTSNVPIVVERAQYWPGGPDTWQETHNSFGLTEPGLKWGLSEGRIGGDSHFQPYILVANPGNAVANVSIRFLREAGSGKAPFTRTFTVQPNSRFTVFGDAGIDVSPLSNEAFGAVLTSDQPIVVERALYSDALGIHWQAGSNATATRLPATVP